MAKVEIINLNKTYSQKVVPVNNISLQVADGEFLTLLGPSGCGKSTTLRMIAGLEQPTRGKILIGGRDVTNLKPGDRNMAMVFQSYALYPHMKVYDNLASGLKLKKVPSSEIKQRIAECAKLLGLEALMDRKPGQLSGGQRQRVALGRALVRRPDVFLLDEPLSNLDALLRERVRAEMKKIFASQQVPVIYVTHDQTEAMTLSNKVAVLNNGIVQQLDTPTQIYTHPANKFVASFVGSPQMNLLQLQCHRQAAVLGDFLMHGRELLQMPPSIILGIRPEHLRLARPEDPQKIEGTVDLVENLGMHNLIRLRVEGADGLTLRVLLPNDQAWEGERLTLAVPPDRIHWFDVQTGDRL